LGAGSGSTSKRDINIFYPIGTSTEVARLLGVSRMTIHNRENGKLITEEAALAIRAIAKRRNPD